MEKELFQLHIASDYDNKEQLTTVLTITAADEYLPPQLLYTS